MGDCEFGHICCVDVEESSGAFLYGDKLGVFGATLYTCKNYTSPLHLDDDISPGICAQYELQANKALDGYAFIYADYGIFFVSQSNSLWCVPNLGYYNLSEIG